MQFLYFKKYIDQLEKLLSQNKTIDISHNLKDCLIFLNYNKFSFVDYIMDHLKTAVDEIETPPGKISKWYLPSHENGCV